MSSPAPALELNTSEMTAVDVANCSRFLIERSPHEGFSLTVVRDV